MRIQRQAIDDLDNAIDLVIGAFPAEVIGDVSVDSTPEDADTLTVHPDTAVIAAVALATFAARECSVEFSLLYIEGVLILDAPSGVAIDNAREMMVSITGTVPERETASRLFGTLSLGNITFAIEIMLTREEPTPW